MSGLKNDLIELQKANGQDVPDDAVTGLVVQGGGMRGVFSMAALSALEELGLTHSFTHAFGSSSGAINAAYFLAGQARTAVSVYTDHISNPTFINLCRVGKVLDLDFLIDDVLFGRDDVMLDEAAVVSSPTELHIAVTEAETGTQVFLSNHEMADGSPPLKEVLRATAALPVLYNRTVDIGGTPFYDGAVLDAVPLFRALAAGCTNIVVITTQPIPRKGGILRGLGKCLQHLMTRAACKKRVFEDVQHGETLRKGVWAVLERPECLGKDIVLTVISPKLTEKHVSRTTRARGELIHEAEQARATAFEAFGLQAPSSNRFV